MTAELQETNLLMQRQKLEQYQLALEKKVLVEEEEMMKEL